MIIMSIKVLNENELKDVKGGFVPFIVPAGIALGEEAYRHADQIWKGAKQGAVDAANDV